jgi:hypothetical protein
LHLVKIVPLIRIVNTSRAARLLNSRPRTLVFWELSLVISGALIFAAIWRWGAIELRGHLEVLPLTIAGLVWVTLSIRALAWLGFSIALDVIDQHNWPAISSATLALAFIFAGGNVGEGPSYWNNVFSVLAGTTAFFVLLLSFELGTRISISVTEERDLASGIRFGALVLALGLILARAVAGNWNSESATLRDLLRDGWPAGAICLGSTILELFYRAGRSRPFPSALACGVVPGLVCLTCAIGWLIHLGPWEGMP